jgi:hypothetical protein
MPLLFNPHLVYPSDEFGPYLELVGQIVSVNSPLSGGEVGVKVKTERGQFTAYVCKHMSDFVGMAKWVRVRVYDSGGGWYPDNRVMSISQDKKSLLYYPEASKS